MKTITINKLEKLLDSNKLNKEFEEELELLLSAMNDWPITCDDIESFESEVKKFTNSKMSKQNIESILNNIDYSTNAWQAESLSQLIGIYEFHNANNTLEEIFERITTRATSAMNS